MAVRNKDQADGVAVEDVAVAVYRDVQRAFANLLAALPGPMVRASQLEHCLDLDTKVAWQFFKAAKASDPLEAVRHVPTLAAVKKITELAAAKGVSQGVIQAVCAAVKHLDEVGKHHADGRESFAAMVASIRGEDAAEKLTMQARRAAFRANTQLWGSQIGVLFHQCFLRRSPSGEWNSVVIHGKFDHRKLRADAFPLEYGRSGAVPGPDGQILACKDLPIDADAFKKYGIPLLPEFCSKPVPRFTKPTIVHGWHYQTMLGDTLGKQGSIDMVTATYRDYKDHQSVTLPDGRKFTYSGFGLHVPVERAVLEMIIHRPSFGTVKPMFRVMAGFMRDLGTELERPAPLLASFEQVQHLGSFHTAPAASEIRHYSKLSARVLDHLKWSDEEFDLHRVVVSYPMIHTIMGMGFELTG